MECDIAWSGYNLNKCHYFDNFFNLIGNDLVCPLENLRMHLGTKDMTGTWLGHGLKIFLDIFRKKAMAPKSFEDMCPISLELEDKIKNFNNSLKN